VLTVLPLCEGSGLWADAAMAPTTSIIAAQTSLYMGVSPGVFSVELVVSGCAGADNSTPARLTDREATPYPKSRALKSLHFRSLALSGQPALGESIL
jgi:hypothetical protein